MQRFTKDLTDPGKTLPNTPGAKSPLEKKRPAPLSLHQTPPGIEKGASSAAGPELKHAQLSPAPFAAITAQFARHFVDQGQPEPREFKFYDSSTKAVVAYPLEREIGAGGQGNVYAIKGDLSVVVKTEILPMDDADGVEPLADRLTHRLNIVAQLGNEATLHHVSPVLNTAIGARDGELVIHYLIPRLSPMPLARLGGNLGSGMAILDQLLDATGHLLKNGIIHDDIKPANVLCEISAGAAEGINIQVIDFQVATMTTSCIEPAIKKIEINDMICRIAATVMIFWNSDLSKDQSECFHFRQDFMGNPDLIRNHPAFQTLPQLLRDRLTQLLNYTDSWASPKNNTWPEFSAFASQVATFFKS